MSKHFTKILKELKTREEIKALGFNYDELKSLASDLDKNLTIDEQASDDDIESAVTGLVETAIPYLKMAQKTSSRIVKKSLEKAKAQEEDEEEEDDSDDNDETDDDHKTPKSDKSKKASRTTSDSTLETSKLLAKILERMQKQEEMISEMRQGNTKDKRRTQLEKLVKGTGSFGKRALRSFDKISFKDEEDFDDYLEEVRNDLEELNQERANAGLSKLGASVQADKKHEKEEVEVLTDDELDKLASTL